jgi:hypothetical protein
LCSINIHVVKENLLESGGAQMPPNRVEGSMKNRALFAAMLTAGGFLASVAPSQAQYYPYPPPPRPYYRPDPYFRPDPYGGGYYRPPPVQFGNLCVTSRGNCYTRPRPANSSCGCEIPGFGLKRGAIVAPNRGW